MDYKYGTERVSNMVKYLPSAERFLLWYEIDNPFRLLLRQSFQNNYKKNEGGLPFSFKKLNNWIQEEEQVIYLFILHVFMEVLAGLDPHGKKFNFLQSLLSYIFIFIIFRVNYINGL